MTYPRYIKRKGKIYGPYYYKSVRDEKGDVLNVYVGRKPLKSNNQSIRLSKPLLAKMAFVLVSILVVVAFGISYTSFLLTEEPVHTEAREINIEMNGSAVRIFGIEDIPDVREIKTARMDKVKVKNKDVKLGTDIVAADVSGMQAAEITLEKTGNVNAILECPDYDFQTDSCPEWIYPGIPFTDNGTHITFTVNHFSGYAGADITIINVQSYPTVGGEWTVAFNTTGYANLTITAVQGTEWSESEGYDLKFLEIRCGSQALNYTWIDYSPGNGSVFVENYSCTENGYETSRVLTGGKHTLEFSFGEDVGYARNFAIYNCTNCSDCNTKIAAAADYDVVQLNTSVSGQSGTCISFGGKDNLTFDCLSNIIDGDDLVMDYGIWLNQTGDGSNNNTVRNCLVTGFYYGLYLSSSSNNTLTNITANSNTNYGLYLSSSSNNSLTNINAFSNSYGVYILSSSNYNNLMNITANSNTGQGLHFSSSSGNNITSITANSNADYGLYLDSSSNNTFTDVTLKENTVYDIYLTVSSDSHCTNTISNATGSGDYPIGYYNSSVNLSNETLSELILCNADNADISNITIIASSSKLNNGILAFRTDYSNLTGINSSYNYYGMYLSTSSNNTLTNITANSNSLDGIRLVSSLRNNLTGITIDSNPSSGIYLDGNSDYNNLTNVMANLTQYTIYLTSSNNVVKNVTVNWARSGLYLSGSSNNTFTDITSSLNDWGIYNGIGIYIYASSNYNNFTNVIANSNTAYGVYLYSTSNYNTFTNVTTSSNSIYGLYFSSSSGNNITGINATENGDYDMYVYVTSDSQCNNTITNATGSGNLPIRYFYSAQNLSNETLSELILCNADGSNISNITIMASSSQYNNGILVFRTDRSNLMGINSSHRYYGIYLISSSNNNLTNVTVNSNMANLPGIGGGYNYGLYLDSSSNNTFTDITANLQANGYLYSGAGIRLYSNSNYNNFTNVIVTSNNYGINMDTNYNKFTNVTATSNTGGYGGGGIYSEGSGNTFTDINASYNSQNGIYVNSGDNNTLTNIAVNSNLNYGLYFLSNFRNNMVNITANSNSYSGVYLYISSNNTIANLTASHNLQRGVFISSLSQYNTINDSRIENNSNYGIYLNYPSGSNYPRYNTFWNNYLNNTVNLGSNNANNLNYWNITKTQGTNIIGGPYIGGNYWTDPDGSNYSDTCTDSSPDDYICDTEYPAYTNNTDYLPLAKDRTGPVVSLESPANDTTNTTTGTPDFTFNATDVTSSTISCILYINNSQGQVNPYGANSSVYNATSTTITANSSLMNGAYWWWVNCTDNLSNTGMSEKRLLTIGQESYIIINLESPQNNTINATDYTPDFYFNASHNKASLSCTLYMNNSQGTVMPYGTNSSVLNDTSTEITANSTLANGQYWWWINCSNGVVENISEQRLIEINISLNISEFLNPASAVPGQNVTVYGHAELTNGTVAANTSIFIYLNGTQLIAGGTTWWNSSWSYRQKINLSVSSGSTPQNYQIQLILNTSNNGTNFNWSRDCNDIRFVNGSNNAELGYWIESCNSTYQNATIWVKVDQNITTSGYPIYMYYGNAGAANVSNGEATFELFDEFEGSSLNTSKWDYTGTVTVSGGYAQTTANTNANKAYSKSAYLGNYSVRFWIMSTGTYGRCGFQKTITQFMNTGEMIGIQTNGGTGLYTNIGNTAHMQNDDGSTDTTNWHTIEMLWLLGTSAQIKYDGTNLRTTTDTAYIPDEGEYVKFADFLKVDRVVLRKYASQQPGANVSSEESGGVVTNSSGDYNYTFTAPSTLGTYPVKVNMTYAGYYGENTTNLYLEGLALSFASPTLENQSATGNDWIFVNVSANENLNTCLLDWYNGSWQNESMDVTGSYCYKNMTSLTSGSYYFRVYGNDSAGNMNVTEDMQVTVDLTPPYYQNDQDNSSGSVSEGDTVKASAYWSDALSGLGAAILRTNETGSWANEGYHTFSGKPEYSNFTIDTTGYASKTICWVIWANDSQSNMNSSMGLSEHCFNVVAEESVLTIESINIQPDEGNPGIIINPVESSNKTANVTVTVTNSTSIDTCEVRIFNSSMSYSNPVFLYTGTIQNCAATCDCFREWDMEYWRNDGDWNVSVYMNLTTGVGNFTSQNFTYNSLFSITVNTSTITFTGIPEQTVNSTDAYPLEIKNTGNQLVNISIKGTDFTGISWPSYIVGVGNSTYNETANGAYQQLTNSYVQVFEDLAPAVAKNLFFRAYLPVGFIQQDYQNTIEITS